jgi:hydroxymethylglutaryl-CoA reductase
MEQITGFSKLSRIEKIEWLNKQNGPEVKDFTSRLNEFRLKDQELQKQFDSFSENTVSNFHLPFGLAPNFLINEQVYTVPMVTEESSVVAAAAKSAKFWLSRGGFKTRIIDETKSGSVHFFWYGDKGKLVSLVSSEKEKWLNATIDLTEKMERRGGGIVDAFLENLTDQLDHYFKFTVKFKTCDAMGANFINSVLERLASCLHADFASFVSNHTDIRFEINMAILSNYTPECRVECEVGCSLNELGSFDGLSSKQFAEKFKRAVDIARVDPYRAVTHNKGILNGVDSVVLATGNDFRAVEACTHAYAARDGKYRSLSSCEIKHGEFVFKMDIPLSIGTVGGLTSLHPMSKMALDILGRPSAKQLMMIISAVGLAQNFGALSSLITSGIQKGHMKMHLLNILNQLKANDVQSEAAVHFFGDKIVSVSSVRNFLNTF